MDRRSPPGRGLKWAQFPRVSPGAILGSSLRDEGLRRGSITVNPAVTVLPTIPASSTCSMDECDVAPISCDVAPISGFQLSATIGAIPRKVCCDGRSPPWLDFHVWLDSFRPDRDVRGPRGEAQRLPDTQ